MSHLKRSYPGPTKARTCKVLVPIPGSVLPMFCGDRVFKAGRCRDHWLDEKNGRESRRGTEAVNRQRREIRGKALPKDLSRATVATRMVWAEKKQPPPIDDRRRKQGVTQATQDYLIEAAARKRARRCGVDYDALKKKDRAHYRSVRA